VTPTRLYRIKRWGSALDELPLSPLTLDDMMQPTLDEKDTLTICFRSDEWVRATQNQSAGLRIRPAEGC
jgi:hypothetical protein